MFFIALAPGAFAATITSAGGGTAGTSISGDWSNTSTWAGGTVPTASDNVIILEWDQVNVNINSAVCASIVLNNGTDNDSYSFLTFASGSQLTVSGAVTMGNSSGNHHYGSLYFVNSGSSTLIAGSLVEGSNQISDFTGGAGTIKIKSTSTLPHYAYNNVTIDASSGTVTLGAAMTIGGNLLINTGTLDAGSHNLTVFGNFTNSGSFAPHNTTLIMGGSSVQTFGGSSGGYSLNNLTISNSNGVNLSVPVIVNNNLTMSSGSILSLGNNTLSVSGAISGSFGSSTFIQTNGTGFLEMTATTSGTLYPIGYGNYNPITINPVTGSSTFDARVGNGVKDNNGNTITQHAVNANWTVQTPTGTGQVIVTPQWNGTDELTSFNRAKSYVASRTSSPTGNWTNSTGNAAAQGNDPYTRTSGTLSIGSGAPLFIAVGDLVSALPVTLVSFNANYENNQVNLNWSTASEINNHYFNIERSIDGQTWQTIGRVEGHGNSLVTQNYFAVDNLAGVIPTGDIYYRLQQVDFNESAAYSMIRSVTINSVPVAVNTYPNPAVNTLNVSWSSEEAGNTVLKLINITGVTIYSENVSGLGLMHKQIDMSNYPTGTYFLQLVTDKNFSSQTIIKN